MNRRQLIITCGIIVIGLLLAFPLTWMFNGSGSSRWQVVPVPESQRVIHQADSNGVEWAITPTAGRSVAIEPNGAQVKPVIVVKTDVFQAGGRDVLIGLILQDRDGRSYHPAVARGGTRQPAPTLRIVNEAGEVLLDASFRYG